MMQILNHHIYEFKKGVREMVLCTLSGSMEEKAKARLEKDGIAYMIQRQVNGNINVFFGKKDCLLVACDICKNKPLNKLTPEEDYICKNKPLNKLTPEEDFMLGMLLGYSLCEQCKRYSKRKEEKKAILDKLII